MILGAWTHIRTVAVNRAQNFEAPHSRGMRVLLAIVSDGGTCTLGCAVSMVRLQNALMTVPGLNAVVCVTGSVAEAVRAAAEGRGDQQFDAVVAISSHLTFPVAFVTKALMAPGPFVCGVHPLPALDWGRVKRSAGSGGERELPEEDLRYAGNTYNIDPATARVSSHTGYATVTAAKLGAVVLHGEAIKAVAAGCGGDDGHDGDDGALCRAWGRPILADLENPCAVMGPMEFLGCAGVRARLR